MPSFEHIRWGEIQNEVLNPLIERRFVSASGVTVARFLLRKGVVVPMHSHPNEQVTYILEGALRFEIEGREVIVAAGEVLVIPAGVPHQAVALEETINLDVFHPPRADFHAGGDQYLRSPSTTR